MSRSSCSSSLRVAPNLVASAPHRRYTAPPNLPVAGRECRVPRREVFLALTDRAATLTNHAMSAYSSLPSRGDRLVLRLCTTARSGSSAGVVPVPLAGGALAVTRYWSTYCIQSARPPCSRHPGMARCHPRRGVGAPSLCGRRCNPEAPSAPAHAYSGSPVTIHDDRQDRPENSRIGGTAFQKAIRRRETRRHENTVREKQERWLSARSR
jgi:hypothetical protein